MAINEVRGIQTAGTLSVQSATAGKEVSKSGSSGDSLSRFKESLQQKSDEKKEKNKNGRQDSANGQRPVNPQLQYRRMRRRIIPKDVIMDEMKYHQNVIKNKIKQEEEKDMNDDNKKTSEISANNINKRNMAAKMYSDIAEEMRFL